MLVETTKPKTTFQILRQAMKEVLPAIPVRDSLKRSVVWGPGTSKRLGYGGLGAIALEDYGCLLDTLYGGRLAACEKINVWLSANNTGIYLEPSYSFLWVAYSGQMFVGRREPGGPQ